MTLRDARRRFVLTSIPLVRTGTNGFPDNAVSGCLIQFPEARVLVTTRHQLSGEGNWALEVETVDGGQTRLFSLDGIVPLDGPDLAVRTVPTHVLPVLQLMAERGRVIHAEPRMIVRHDRITLPNRRRRYGFAGRSGRDRVDRFVVGDLRVEFDLKYVGDEDACFIFDLGKDHPGDDHYRGCSGAPILDREGTLVALVRGPSRRPRAITAVPLYPHRGAIVARASEAAAIPRFPLR